MCEDEFYGETLKVLQTSKNLVMERIEEYRQMKYQGNGENPLEYCKARIKKPDSMIAKLQRHNLPINVNSAIRDVKDAIGIRIICDFVDAVYDVVAWFKQQATWQVVNEKDYIKHPKVSGYRSYHVILQLDNQIYVEIQIRTIAMDFWASLEHQLKYKKNITHQKVIVDELKRCADEIASIDLSMQTIKELLQEDF